MLTRVFSVMLAVLMVGLSWAQAPDVCAEDKKLKVAFALLWTIDDQGWTTSHCQNQDHPRLTIQRLGFTAGNSTGNTFEGGGGGASTSRCPLCSGGLTTPAASISSTSLAARL